MTQEEKDLLLKDLCARLPYKVKVVRKRNEIYLDYSYTTYEFLAFHTLEQCELFLEEYEDLIRDYFML